MTVSLTICSSVGWASAEQLSGTATGYFGYINSSGGFVKAYGTSLSYSGLSEQTLEYSLGGMKLKAVGLGSLDLSDDGTYYTGAVGVYFSYYISCSSISSLVANPSPPSTRYRNHLGQDGTGDNMVKITSFTPAGITPGAASGYTRGYSVNAQFVGSEDAPISFLRVVGDSSSVIANCDSSSMVYRGEMYFSSLRVVGTETSADLEALEGIADAIAAQSDILQAMYGDLIAVCNSIYQRTGDILQAQQLTNEYFSQVIPLLNSLKNITSDIYTLLQAQFNLLISTIETASTDIQGAISAQTAALIAYLDSVFQAGVNPDTAQRTEDIETGLGSLNDGESTYTSAATERYEALTANFSGFEGDTLSGVALVSNLFKQVWDAFGDYNLVYIFPLTFGLSLVFLGRLSRFHQHEAIRDSRRSRGEGGKSKGKDG